VNNDTIDPPTDSFGFLYVLTNPFMPGVVKIGQTERHQELRAAELSYHKGVPHAFTVAFYVEVTKRFSAENVVHAALSGDRVSADREFFKLSLGEAISFIANTVFEYVPENSSFRPVLERLVHGFDMCPKCTLRMNPAGFRVSWKCAGCGHSE
jgi:T5orf172 domain